MSAVIVELDQDVRIPLGSSSVIVSAKTILGDLLARLQPKPKSEVPGIGARWQGGIYAGVVRGAENQPDYHLIVLDVISMKDLKWQAALDWAAGLENEGFKDFTLPCRRDQSVMFANVKELFEDAYYWSRDEYAGVPDYAWYTYFDNGNQNYYHKVNTCRARAVRRLPI